FFGHMKDEIDYKNCMTLSDLEKVINKYMKYYNNHRYQWNLKKMTPVEYRNQLLAA
ncbi:IS3 family transposase, partial [Clostridium botulinum]|nr:IS3 family transposase [Clostridium botulinum]NFL62517.1 IS3 family transposase [Clostridium botulinum]NFO66864.1 IS3 family transposase [Clostridium botulinum]